MSNSIYNVAYSIIICIFYSLANKYLATFFLELLNRTGRPLHVFFYILKLGLLLYSFKFQFQTIRCQNKSFFSSKYIQNARKYDIFHPQLKYLASCW